MIDSVQLRTCVIRPVLEQMDLYSQEAQDLILGTICQESQCGRYLKQLGSGPALGICQMEPATHDDIHESYLEYRPELLMKVRSFCAPNRVNAQEMIGNLNYAVAMCRIHYLRKPAKIPSDMVGQAEYWKQYYNTPEGKGTTEEFIANWKKYAR